MASWSGAMEFIKELGIMRQLCIYNNLYVHNNFGETGVFKASLPRLEIPIRMPCLLWLLKQAKQVVRKVSAEEINAYSCCIVH